jgi:pyruvate carboxylase
MPDAIVNVGVTVGQSVNADSTLLSLDAVKMETHVAADRVQTKELLVALRAVGGWG